MTTPPPATPRTGYRAVLDVSALPTLRGVEDRGDHWRIGACTNWTDLLRAGLPPCFDGLSLAPPQVGGGPVQNAGTGGGNQIGKPHG